MKFKHSPNKVSPRSLKAINPNVNCASSNTSKDSLNNHSQMNAEEADFIASLDNTFELDPGEAWLKQGAKKIFKDEYESAEDLCESQNKEENYDSEEGNRDMPIIRSSKQTKNICKEEDDCLPNVLENGGTNENADCSTDDLDVPLHHPPKKKKSRKKKPKKSLIDSDDEPLSNVRKALINERGQKRNAETSVYKKKRKFSQSSDEENADYYTKKFSVTGYWYVAAGYLNDIIELLDAFERCPYWSFDGFSECWREAKFSLIYRGRQTFKELLEFSEEVCLLTKRFLYRPHSSKKRIGALYTLYGLYYKHPLRCFFSIRMEFEEYKELVELVRPFFSNPENPDPAFIFRKLEYDGAFRHCASSTELCFELHNNERALVDLEYGKEKLAKSSVVNEAAPIIQLEADQILLNSYQQAKQEVIDGTSLSGSAMSMVNQNFVKDVIRDLTEFRKQTLDELNIREPVLPPEGVDETNIDGGEIPNIPSASNLESLINPHQVSGKLLDTVNNSRTAEIVRNREDELKLLNENTVEIMSEPASIAPLQRTRYNKPRFTKDRLTLDDLGPKKQLYTDNRPDLRELLNDVPPPKKRRRKPARSKEIIKAITAANMKTNACWKPPKLTLGDSEDEQQKENGGTETLPLPLNIPEEKPSLLDLTVKILMDGQEIKRQIKVNVSESRWQEILQNPERLDRFKIKIKPLLNLAKKQEQYSILDIEANPQNSPSEKVTDSSIVINSTYMKENRQPPSPMLSDVSSKEDKRDADFELESCCDEVEGEIDSENSENLLAELESSPTSSPSDESKKTCRIAKKVSLRPKRAYHRRTKTNFGVTYLTNDNPLSVPSETERVPLTKINIGGTTKLLPVPPQSPRENVETSVVPETMEKLLETKSTATAIRQTKSLDDTEKIPKPAVSQKDIDKQATLAKFNRMRERLRRQLKTRNPKSVRRNKSSKTSNQLRMLAEEWEDEPQDEDINATDNITEITENRTGSQPEMEDYNSLVNAVDPSDLNYSLNKIQEHIVDESGNPAMNMVDLNHEGYQKIFFADGREMLVPKYMIVPDVPQSGTQSGYPNIPDKEAQEKYPASENNIEVLDIQDCTVLPTDNFKDYTSPSRQTNLESNSTKFDESVHGSTLTSSKVVSTSQMPALNKLQPSPHKSTTQQEVTESLGERKSSNSRMRKGTFPNKRPQKNRKFSSQQSMSPSKSELSSNLENISESLNKSKPSRHCVSDRKNELSPSKISSPNPQTSVSPSKSKASSPQNILKSRFNSKPPPRRASDRKKKSTPQIAPQSPQPSTSPSESEVSSCSEKNRESPSELKPSPFPQPSMSSSKSTISSNIQKIDESKLSPHCVTDRKNKSIPPPKKSSYRHQPSGSISKSKVSSNIQKVDESLDESEISPPRVNGRKNNPTTCKTSRPSPQPSVSRSKSKVSSNIQKVNESLDESEISPPRVNGRKNNPTTCKTSPPSPQPSVSRSKSEVSPDSHNILESLHQSKPSSYCVRSRKKKSASKIPSPSPPPSMSLQSEEEFSAQRAYESEPSLRRRNGRKTKSTLLKKFEEPVLESKSSDENGSESLIKSQSPLKSPVPSTLNLREHNAKPMCSFLFSPKMRSLARHKSSKIEASGTPPQPNPRVTFFKKGFLSPIWKK